MTFSEQQMLRYARQIILPEVGGKGQLSLLEAKVLLIGAGGLGSPLLLYLAAAGIGTIGIVDDDAVDLTNLHRQIAHRTQDLATAKVESAHAAATALNPEVKIIEHRLRIDGSNAADLVRSYDLVADGSDNIATRDAVHRACFDLRRPLVSAAVQGMEGQLSTFKAFLGPPHPCYRCLFPDLPPPDMVPTCAQGGVLGPVAGVMGCLQAVEVIKEIVNVGSSLSGTLLLYDAMNADFSRVHFQRRPACKLCGRD